jgi:hypothetical protein
MKMTLYRLRSYAFASSIFSVILFFLTYPSSVFAAGEPPATFDQLNGVFQGLVSIVVVVGGFLSFLALIFGGFRFIMARGDPKATASAQGTVTWAIVGLVFVIIAWLILVFIFGFTGVDVRNFCIGVSCSP